MTGHYNILSLSYHIISVQQLTHTGANGRKVGRRMVVARSNGSRTSVKSQSNRDRIVFRNHRLRSICGASANAVVHDMEEIDH